MRFKALLGFCVAVADGTFKTHDTCGNALFATLRFKGYTAALTGGYVNQVILFGPAEETDVITAYMVALGASPREIEAVDTHVTTIGNARVMQAYLAERDLKRSEVVGSTSHYHLPRAQLMGELLHDLGITWVAAEAFLFAANNHPTEHEHITRDLLDQFGAGALALRTIAEIKGQGDLIAGRYKSPKDRV